MATVSQEKYIHRVIKNFPFRSGLSSTVEREHLLPFVALLPNENVSSEDLGWKVLTKGLASVTLGPKDHVGFFDRVHLNTKTGKVARQQFSFGRVDELMSEAVRRHFVNEKIMPNMKDGESIKARVHTGIESDEDNIFRTGEHMERTWKHIMYFLPHDVVMKLHLTTMADVQRRSGHLVRVPTEVKFEISERSKRTHRLEQQDLWMLIDNNVLEERVTEFMEGWKPKSKDRLLLHRLFPATAGSMKKEEIIPRFRKQVLRALVAPPGSSLAV